MTMSQSESPTPHDKSASKASTPQYQPPTAAEKVIVKREVEDIEKLIKKIKKRIKKRPTLRTIASERSWSPGSNPSAHNYRNALL